MKTFALPLALLSLVPAGVVSAQVSDVRTAPYPASLCASCAGWNTPTDPVRVFGGTYWVGTRQLGAILVTSDAGHVLIDGALPESAPAILDHIRSLGFDPTDIRLILNTHAHYDHAGGIAVLQEATGAEVVATMASAAWLERGASGTDDPQYSIALDYPAVADVRIVADGDTLRVGTLAVVAHATGGHTPGGTTWSWRDCEEGRCMDVVYVDSQTAVSADGFLFTASDTYPAALPDFEHGLATIQELRCDVLLTPHPGFSRFWDRIATRDAGDEDALVDAVACRRFAAAAREALAVRVERERTTGR